MNESLERIIIRKALGQQALEQHAKGDISNKAFADYIPEITKLSEAYNFPEKKLQTALNQELALKAYLLYFLPINQFKLQSLLQRVSFPGDKIIRVLDFGCGPGTGSLAAIETFKQKLEINLFDISGKASQFAKELIKEFSPGTKANLKEENWKKEKYDLIIAANSLNEISDPEITTRDLLASLEESGVLVILEPALKIKTRKAMELRDFILNQDKTLTVLFPCTRNDACPMLKEDDWCHGSLTWKGTKLVNQIDNITGFNKHRLKYSAFIFQRKASLLDGYRVVNIPEKDKTGFTSKLCGKDLYGFVKLPKRNKNEDNRLFEKGDLWDRVVVSEEIQENAISKTAQVEIA